MLDFTSALYLGMRHGSAELGPWPALSLGRPAVLEEPPGAAQLAPRLARLQGAGAALLLPSTLHLFFDLLGMLAGRGTAFLVDAAAYPIARWGLQCALGRGARHSCFPHHDVDRLADLAAGAQRAGRRPVIVSDGYCLGCGRIAPLSRYAQIAARHEGFLVLDDTQAIGILGSRVDDLHPLGRGGGGSLRWHGVSGPRILAGASLAKAFGAPLAVLAGDEEFIRQLRTQGDTRVHCSPPSAAAIQAAQRALDINQLDGEAMRRTLCRLAQRLRAWAACAGLSPVGRLPFPVQSFRTPNQNALELQQRLMRRGVRAIVTLACDGVTQLLTFLLSARHGIAHIDAAGCALAQAVHEASHYCRIPSTAPGATPFPSRSSI
jgi:8-amino-7-oxononanoate synthase